MTPGRLHLATSDLPERDRVPFMRDFYGRAIMGLDLEPLAGGGFDMDMSAVQLPQIGIAHGRLSPLAATRDASLAQDGNTNIMLGLFDQGFVSRDRRRDEVELGGSDALAMPLDQPLEWMFHKPGVTTALHLDRAALLRLTPKFDPNRMRRLQGLPGLDLIFPYAQAVLKASNLTPAAAALASRQILELAAFILSGAAHPDEVGASESLRAARLAALKRDVAARFHMQGLSVRDLALRHGVSVRYVQMLFEQDGMTFTDYLQRTRLEFAHARLLNADGAVRILDIAVEAGFTDLSTFNRLFRKRYGDAPSALRARQRSDPA